MSIRLFGAYLRAHRVRLGLTREALAKRCNDISARIRGISAVSIRFWENSYEGRVPSIAQLAVLGDALGWNERQLATASELLRLDAERVPGLPAEEPSAA